MRKLLPFDKLRTALPASVVVALLWLTLACAAPASPTPTPPLPAFTPVPEPAVIFAKGAFPPPMPDIEQHQEAWLIIDCIKCHSEELGQAPTVKHEGLPELLLQVNCRTCHVFISEEAASVSRK